jgi:hypothetical protein
MSAEVLAPLLLHPCTDSDSVHMHSFVNVIVYHMFVLYFNIHLLLYFLKHYPVKHPVSVSSMGTFTMQGTRRQRHKQASWHSVWHIQEDVLKGFPAQHASVPCPCALQRKVQQERKSHCAPR